MPTNPTATQDEAEIRKRLTAWAKTLHAKDLNALMALYDGSP
jgi:ketosteroid isomerase-like protein